MPNLAQMKALLSLNIGRDVGKAANVLSNAEIEAAIKARFPGAKITAHDVIPAQPGTKFGPFESTSRVTLQGAPGSLNDRLFGLSQDLKQQAIPGINHSTNEAVLAGPQAADWGSEFSKSHFVHPGDQTAFGNRQEDFKNQFTGGFYHGSPANNIEAFDPTKSAKDPMYITPKATFVTRDPEFAESFLSMNNSGKMKTGSTMYPVSVNLGQHWHPNTPEGQQVISDFVEKYPKRAGLEKGLNRGDWTAIENSDFLTHLKDTGHDTFHVMEGGIPNVGVLKPENIRGKFAEFNPDEAANPDFMKAEGGVVESHAAGGKVGMLAELMQLVKQQGGSGAAKRLERAADLVPNLENKFQPQALKSAFTGDNASAVMVMPPNDFQKFATPLPTHHKEWGGFTMPDGSKGDYQDYLNLLGQYSKQGGLESVPYLQLDQKTGSYFPNIAGHEGRNRSDALAKLGDQSSLVQMMPRANLRESLPRRSQEEYLDALHEKIGSKPMVTPEPDFNPETGKDISRGLIQLPEMFAKGGSIQGYQVGGAIKKALKFAEDVPFLHYSNKPSLTSLEPGMYGTGIKGAEAARLKDAPELRPRSYFYVDKGGDTMRPEQGLGNQKYQGTASGVYNLAEDPEGFHAIAKSRALDPYMMSFGREMVDPAVKATELERLIKGAGYEGYHTGDVGLMFNPTPVSKAP